MSKSVPKVGILTFHDALNHGAVLQAYALSRKINELGAASARVIDYKCPKITKSSDYRSLIKIKPFPKGVLIAFMRRPLINKFASFKKKYLSLTNPIRSKNELKQFASTCDAIVTGSDQVWNTAWTDRDTAYLLDLETYNGKKCSYAASFGFDRIPDNLVSDYKRMLSDYSMISVREESGSRILSSQLGLSCEKLVDPTLLLDLEKWKTIAVKPKVKHRYLFLYMVPLQSEVVQYAKKMAQEKGLQLIIGNNTLRYPTVRHTGAYAPDEFLGYIQNAEYIITNSFHGTAFSVIFQKKFSLFLNNPRGYNERSRDLLALCGLVSSDYHAETFATNNVDWKSVNNNISLEVAKAEHFLRQI